MQFPFHLIYITIVRLPASDMVHAVLNKIERVAAKKALESTIPLGQTYRCIFLIE